MSKTVIGKFCVEIKRQFPDGYAIPSSTYIGELMAEDLSGVLDEAGVAGATVSVENVVVLEDD